MGQVLVAYSGGVDSSFLLKRAVMELGSRARGVIVKSESLPRQDWLAAKARAASWGAELLELEVKELSHPELTQNDPDRCYHCKTLSYGEILDLGRSLGIPLVLDGTNADDLQDYRPGRKAAEEQGVISPLAEVGLTKNEIRHLSRALGLETWDLPSSPCLNSRVPYGQPITGEKLLRIESAEAYLKSLGFLELRVRHHEGLARIELPQRDLERALGLAPEIESKLKTLGFTWVTLDLGGLRSGSLNLGIGIGT